MCVCVCVCVCASECMHLCMNVRSLSTWCRVGYDIHISKDFVPFPK